MTPAIRDLFSPAPGTIYLDAATYGLPPRPTIAALETALGDWQSGTAEWQVDWDRVGEECRTIFATLIGATPDSIALIPTVSAGVGLVAASVAPGSEILVPEEEFTSVLFPFLVAEQARGATVREVPLAELAGAIKPQTRLVAFSLTRSQDGQTAPLADICAAARNSGTQLLVDATHAIPFVSVEPYLTDIDFLICHGYKHLLCPRGVAFMYIRQDRWDALAPWFAGWRAGAPLYGRSFGGPLTLAANASRFDLSLAWHAWVGAKVSLDLLVAWEQQGILARVLDLARQLATTLDLPPPTSTLVAVPATDAQGAAAALSAAGVRCAARATYIRLSPHVYNTSAEIDWVASLITSLPGDQVTGSP